jgi:hypothetical protein
MLMKREIAVVAFLLGLAALLVASSWRRASTETAEYEKTWRGTRIVRICPDGTRIVRRPDGEHFTEFGQRPVSGPEVCG